MARIRSIKPETWVDEKLASLEPLDRLAFIGLWNFADREGRLEDRPRQLSVCILPYDKGDFNARLQRLHEKQFIRRYAVDGKCYILVTNFKKHQRPHHTEQASLIPAPGPKRASNGAGTVSEPLSNGVSTDIIGREGKGKERKEEASPTHPQKKEKFLEFIQLTQAEHDKLVIELGTSNLSRYMASLNDYIGSRGKHYKSHYHTILAWFRRDLEQGKARRPPPAPLKPLKTL